MYFQILLGLLSFCFAQSLPVEQYYVNNENSLPDQQFFYSYQPRNVIFYPNDINRPVFHPELGMSPQYHDLVYNYVKDFAGTEPPAHTNTIQPNNLYHNQFLLYGNAQDRFSESNEGVAESSVQQAVNVHKPEIQASVSQFQEHMDAIKMKRIHSKTRPTSLPPVNGVVSNYVLSRSHPNQQNLLQLNAALKENNVDLQQHNKRQIPDNTDSVVINAEPAMSTKASEESEPEKEEADENKEEQQMGPNPGIAQSKPSAIALAGPGGVAQASPVGTALVGQGGLAVAAPSGTAVAGPAGQGALPIHIGGEKQKSSEKIKEDSY